MSRNTLSAIENGKYHYYGTDFLFAICELFNCEMGYLLCEYDEKRRIKADIKEATGLESNVIDIILNMKNSFLKLSLLNDLLKDDYFLAIIDLLYMADYHSTKGMEFDKIETEIESKHKNAETSEERKQLEKRFNDYRVKHTLHDANTLANRYRLIVAFSRLLDKRYNPLPEIDASNLESKWKQENPTYNHSTMF